MQSTINEIYNITSVKTGVSENIYKTIGDFIFKEIKSNIEKPKSLIIKVKGLGFWYLRKSKLKVKLSVPPENENKKDMYNLLMTRLKEYEDYTKEKSEIKIRKDEFKKVFNREKESESSCKD